ncbi:MAG: TonB-dependent receptor, partial [Acidobacteriaceae bacterium]|nr:TonB-dependent receptor [Acidobacteriaceae bacterium]
MIYLRPLTAAVPMLAALALACVAEGQQDWAGVVRNEANQEASHAVLQLKGSTAQFSQTAGDQGGFRFVQLPSGTYRLVISYEGRSFRLEEPVSLPITGVSQLMLTAQGSIVMQASEQTQTSGGTLAGNAVTAIPLNKRDFSQLLLLAAGTMTDTNGTTNFTQQFAINGQRGVEAVFTMDGALSSDPEMGGATMSNFNVDAVEEIQSQSGWMPAEIGYGAAGFTNIITRRGMDSLHGSIFEFLRNSALDARNFFDRETAENPERIPAFRRNEFGFTMGGTLPVAKTAFFVEYQGFRQVLGTTQVLAVPTAAERNGIDTTAFPGDTLYVSVNPTMAALLNRYPLPNDPTGPFGARTFATSSKVKTDADQFSARLDHDIASHDRLFARFSWDNLKGPTTNPDQTAIQPSWGITYIDHQRNAALGWSHVPSATFTSQLELSFTRTTPQFPTADQTDPSLVLADGSYEAFDSAAGSVAAAYGNLFEARQDFTWIRGAHTIKAGGLFTANRDTTYFGTAPNGQYTFGGGTAYATEPIASASGTHKIGIGQQLPDTLTALLLGSAFSYSVAVAPPEFPQGAQIGVAAISRYGVNAYWQDTWKIGANLNIDYGVRYEIYSPISERAHRTGGMRFLDGPQQGSEEQYLINPEPRYRWRGNNWGPRVRVNWQAAHDLWLRAGGALTTIPPNIWQDNFLTGSAPYVDYPRLTAAPGSPVLVGTRITPTQLPPVYNLAGVNVLSSRSSLNVPANTIWDVNRFEQELAAATGTASITPLNASAISQSFRNAYLATWSVNVERAFHGISASAGYLGTA